MNIAARAGKWSAAHWKTATFGWLALVIAAVVIGGRVGSVPLTNAENSTGESARAHALFDAAGFRDRAGESVLVQSRSLTVSDLRFQQQLKRVVGRLHKLAPVENVRSPGSCTLRTSSTRSGVSPTAGRRSTRRS
jgi:RND superfamily putative drug exporter